MKLDVKKTKLEGVHIIMPPTNFEDFRGTYVETYNYGMYQAAGIQCEFIQCIVENQH